MTSTISLEVLSAVSDEDALDIAGLLRQLSATATFSRRRLTAIAEHQATDLIVARQDGRIIGMATLVLVPLPSGLRGHVEDVVVDGSARGQGVARLLLQEVTERATERGARTLDLTSRSSRESALRLYESVGFERRDTNVLRFTPDRRRDR